MYKLLLQLFVSQFYSRNTGFFLFWFLLFFGVVSGSSLISYHVSLIRAITDIVPLLVLVIAGWLLYALKCLRFMEETQLKHHAAFLHVLAGLPKRQLIWINTMLYSMIFCPVSIYATVVVIMAAGWGHWGVMAIVVLFLLAVTAAAVYRLVRLMSWGSRQHTPFFYEKWLTRKRPLPYYWLLVQYAIAEKKMNILLLKAFSFLFLFLAFIWLADDFVQPAFRVALVLIALGHAVFMAYLQKFLEEKLVFLRTLPLPLWGKLLMFLLPAILVFIPELLFMLANARQLLSGSDMLLTYAVLVSQLVLYVSVLYITSMSSEAYMRILFAISFVDVFLYMAVDIRLMIGVQLLIACGLLVLRYRRYEHVVYTD